MSSAIIEVIIGLVLVYSLLSLLTSQINDLVVSILNIRAEHLRVELEKLVSDPELRDELLSHPLINMAKEEVERTLWQRLRDFRTALCRRIGLLPRPENPDLATTDVTYIDPNAFVQALMSLLGMADDAQVQRVLEALQRREELRPFQETMKTVLAKAQTLEDVQQRLLEWFHTFENHLSDLYKRNVQRFLLFIGLALAVILNIDSLYLAEALWNDPTLRQAVANTAETTLQTYDEAQAEADQPALGADPLAETREAAEDAQQTIDALLDLRLPIGWINVAPQDAQEAGMLVDLSEHPRNVWSLWPANNANWLGFWLRKLIGWGLTGIAVMKGSDFWFNLLRQLTGGGGSKKSGGGGQAEATT